MDKSPMQDCQRCPDCFNLLPEVKIEQNIMDPKKDDTVLVCERHGHKAQGDDLIQAVKHWNIYVHFTLAERVRKAS